MTAPNFAVGSSVQVMAGSKTGATAQVEHVVWSERDQCHYFYLKSETVKLSRGYKAEELSAT